MSDLHKALADISNIRLQLAAGTSQEPFLRINFVVQSPLEHQVSSPRRPVAPPRQVGNGERGPSIARWRAARTALLYAGFLLVSIWLVHASGRPDVHALALGLALPGGGFLTWAAADSSSMSLGVVLAAASALFFLAALGLWFATGNVVLPAIVWLGSAIVAAGTISVWPEPFAAYASRPLIFGLPVARALHCHHGTLVLGALNRKAGSA
jgi:hypothetical protein